MRTMTPVAFLVLAVAANAQRASWLKRASMPVC